MKRYYTHTGEEQQGPYDLEELKAKKITKQTMIWFEGIDEWKKAGDIPELQGAFEVTPPPFTTKATPPPPPKPKAEQKPKAEEPKPTVGGGLWKITKNAVLLILIITIVVIGLNVIYRISNSSSSPIKIAVNPPAPRVVTSHSNEDPSSKMFNYKQGVWATVLNDGGSGLILVKATLTQGGNTYEKSEQTYMASNQTQDFHFVFSEAQLLGSNMRYEVSAVSLE